MKQSPLQNRVGMVFIPVDDLPRAIAWYSRLLGQPIGEPSHNGTIYTLEMRGNTEVILDSNKTKLRNSSHPLLCFWTDDIAATYLFLQEMEATLVSQVEDIGDVSALVFKDPDQNLLMAAQVNGLCHHPRAETQPADRQKEGPVPAAKDRPSQTTGRGGQIRTVAPLLPK